MTTTYTPTLEEKEIGDDINMLEDMKKLKIFDQMNQEELPDIGFIANSYQKDDSIILNSSFEDFFCEIEIFKVLPPVIIRFSQPDFNNYLKKIHYITTNLYFSFYMAHLCNKLGNDITLIAPKFMTRVPETITKKLYNQNTFNELSTETRLKRYDGYLSNYPYYLTTDIIDGDDILNYFNNIYGTNSKSELYCILPIYASFYGNAFFMFYSEEILTPITRYSIIPFMSYQDRLYHYNFLFIDYGNKKIELYEPYGNRLVGDYTKRIAFINNCLIDIFGSNWKINVFWGSKGIQNIEGISIESYCVIWGNMIAHLKLLNIEMEVTTIENNLIDYCKKNRISLADLAVNYAHHMSRVIPKNGKKFISLREKLIKNDNIKYESNKRYYIK